MEMVRIFKTILLNVTIPLILYSQSNYLKIDHISVEQGLSTNVVTNIFKDSHGLMWFGTRNGLNSYDGYRFRVYKNIVLGDQPCS